MFTAETDQLALVKAATEAKTSVAAKTTITELWNAGRLGNEGKKAMFETFLKLALVQDPSGGGVKGRRELFIAGKLSFPFNTQIQYDSAIAIDGEPTLKSAGDNCVVLEPRITDFQFGSRGGVLPGRFAKAVIEIKQLDHYPDGKKLWSIRRTLGPIQLNDD